MDIVAFLVNLLSADTALNDLVNNVLKFAETTEVGKREDVGVNPQTKAWYPYQDAIEKKRFTLGMLLSWLDQDTASLSHCSLLDLLRSLLEKCDPITEFNPEEKTILTLVEENSDFNKKMLEERLKLVIEVAGFVSVDVEMNTIQDYFCDSGINDCYATLTPSGEETRGVVRDFRFLAESR